jgi:hypothetical protein
MILPSGACVLIREKSNDQDGRLLIVAEYWASESDQKHGNPLIVRHDHRFGVPCPQHHDIEARRQSLAQSPQSERVIRTLEHHWGLASSGVTGDHENKQQSRGKDVFGFLSHPDVQAIEVTP